MAKAKRRDLARGNAIAGYMFILPFIIGFVLFLLIPLVSSLYMSFTEVDALGKQGFTYTWIGLKNYNEVFFINEKYVPNLLTQLKNMALFVPGILVFSFFMAVLLNQDFHGRTFVRAVYFLPVILSSGIMVGLETNNSLLSSMKDLIEADTSSVSITKTLESILLTGQSASKFFQYVIDLVNQVYDIAIASGIQIIIFLSGLQTISPSMYEAAKIEGCTAWESFWKITFPMISSMILVNMVYTIVDFCTKSNSDLMTLITNTLYMNFEYGLTAAMSWVYFVIIMGILGILSFILTRWVYYYD
ncbi:MAG: sugar ABC transporter permease [Lachnospiraceae bacterium]|nr:sugar ABC transporter permease [Lachnospiraceae bacterium]